jgi:hypothetical protein
MGSPFDGMKLGHHIEEVISRFLELIVRGTAEEAAVWESGRETIKGINNCQV